MFGLYTVKLVFVWEMDSNYLLRLTVVILMTVRQQMEEVWRDARWIMDALQYARYKQPTGGISITWIIDFSKEVLPEKIPSTSSQPDFMPSPMPSPEPCRKHSGQNQLSASTVI